MDSLQDPVQTYVLRINLQRHFGGYVTFPAGLGAVCCNNRIFKIIS